MHKRSIYRIFIILLLVRFSCLGQSSVENATSIVCQIKIDTSVVYQNIDNFGASDAWSCQFVGLWPKSKKEKIASLLFSKEVDLEGNPKGIGLSLWRFNLGAGSSEQAEKSDIKDEWRRAESFLNKNGSYNFQKQKGQVWFAQKAKDYGVDQLLLFSNSPPVEFTKNNKAYSVSGQISNLHKSEFQNFATYLTNSAIGLEKMGLEVDYISPLNEPQWDWADAGQEGTPFWNHEIADFVKVLDSAITKKGIKAKIDITEAGQINYLSREDNRPGRGNQITEFFNSESKNYIGNLPNLSHTISGHSYFTTSPDQKLIKERETLSESLKAVEGLKFWMSEYCILGDNNGEIEGNGRDLGIDPALYMAKVIHSDLAIANASAWHWWMAISPYDYKDGLIYIDKNKKDGNFYESKMLWVLGNYSRFIEPDSKRIKASVSKDSSLLASAYINKAKSKVTLVIINSEEKAIKIKQSLNNNDIVNFKSYTTSKDQDLAYTLNSESHIVIPERSIVTVVSDLK
ncbi:MAG: xylanase [Zunongwangia sp.]|uniref:Xylanase n=1 Tax=Zunongwangia profunda TaxID=398743 RepID=A0A3D5IY61_9FLAO|nr:glycoside hydrolase [Zunongwangia profunda]MAO38176.1 xylanase [Zunongwangia sp.]MAS72104.1 xylanase [Zunongwangia sp.]HCV79986.1 xylanase [Zunongwangia profunda]|tara:strand:- start:493 stop:2034 length:1542 start_codon:yes stop_codon:yes gene_type:complete